MKQSRTSAMGAERGAGAIAQHTPHEQRDFYYDTVAGDDSAFPVMSMSGGCAIDGGEGVCAAVHNEAGFCLRLIGARRKPTLGPDYTTLSLPLLSALMPLSFHNSN
ncbi:hypothetical protein DPX16_3692 [Anabarilius grahami]|uniref:Uncharacterized protein n=1 Tax=Anabarilius grahami TaxID=495550 RepID=A0A3N0YK14_ANAGA|nr:hypothetical protein DPX16_3692 [Anabarilius grahami]